jgi:hypothetical protein
MHSALVPLAKREIKSIDVQRTKLLDKYVSKVLLKRGMCFQSSACWATIFRGVVRARFWWDVSYAAVSSFCLMWSLVALAHKGMFLAAKMLKSRARSLGIAQKGV